MSRINRAARPDKITALDRARQVAAVARHDRQRAQARARERVARLAVFACFIVAAVALFYAASEPEPASAARYDAMRGPAVIAPGLTIGACLDLFSRDVADACERVR